jgi:hypothetical protein
VENGAGFTAGGPVDYVSTNWIRPSEGCHRIFRSDLKATSDQISTAKTLAWLDQRIDAFNVSSLRLHDDRRKTLAFAIVSFTLRE